MSNSDDAFGRWDRQVEAFKKTNPGASYTKYQMEKIAENLKRGASHPTLGRNIDGHDDWWEAGAASYRHYRKLFPIRDDSRVIDYGCGSLRVGAHFIRHLDPGCYFGLELASGLYEIGQEVIGEAMIAEKQPRFGLIGTPAVDSAAAFNADFVYSTSVAFHVAPDELDLYHANLVKLTAKPGATLFFDTKISEKPFRYRERAWAWPLEMYRTALAPLTLVREVFMAERIENGVRFENRILEFRRAG
jgi:SAM-dependent methyltransferase